MRLVIDTNVAVSGLLWRGNPNRVLRTARDGINTLLLSNAVTHELKQVLRYPKFIKRIKQLSTTSEDVMSYYQNLGEYVPINKKAGRKLSDQDDAIFLDLALNGRAHLIISGDRHLLCLKRFKNIPIVTPSEALDVFRTLNA
ncbi:putative toxin-antitoxin system toxin component, PIN family [Fibrobacterota bacterium]